MSSTQWMATCIYIAQSGLKPFIKKKVHPSQRWCLSIFPENGLRQYRHFAINYLKPGNSTTILMQMKEFWPSSSSVRICFAGPLRSMERTNQHCIRLNLNWDIWWSLDANMHKVFALVFYPWSRQQIEISMTTAGFGSGRPHYISTSYGLLHHQNPGLAGSKKE